MENTTDKQLALQRKKINQVRIALGNGSGCLYENKRQQE